MTIHADIVTILSGNTTADDRVMPNHAEEQTQFPYIIYSEIASSGLRTLSGSTGDRKTTFVFMCFAETYAEADTLADEVRAAMEAATNIQHWFEEDSDPDDYEPALDVYMKPVLFSYWHR